MIRFAWDAEHEVVVTFVLLLAIVGAMYLVGVGLFGDAGDALPAASSDAAQAPPPGTGLDLSDLVTPYALRAAADLWDRCASGTWPGCETDGAEVLIGCRYGVGDFDRLCLVVVEAPLCATPRGDK